MNSLTGVKGTLSNMPNAVRNHMEQCKSCKSKFESEFESITTEKALEVLKEMVDVKVFRNYVRLEYSMIDFSGAKFGESNYYALAYSHEASARMPSLKKVLHQMVEDLKEFTRDLSDEDFSRLSKIAEHASLGKWILF